MKQKQLTIHISTEKLTHKFIEQNEEIKTKLCEGKLSIRIVDESFDLVKRLGLRVDFPILIFILSTCTACELWVTIATSAESDSGEGQCMI